MWGGTPAYWEWLSNPDARTSYYAYLVFKLEDGFYGLINVKAIVRFSDTESDPEVKKRAKVVHLSGQGSRARLSLIRSDGWMELKMRNFFNDTEKMDMLKRD
ncbi:hypothetical protein H5410_022656 [Solanum commersonii]|uniref:Uncharacterized protein n=1 Tax=Solanum commersonii TaxID=4109 RepID=A0A9J5ZHE8_SOLCO|nr:hypothetical protein H5410_022656 [Solanum commersonii]